MATIISVISLVIGVLGIYIAFQQMKKKEISHFLIQSYDIGNGLNTVFPDFRISFNNEDLDKYVRVYEGSLLNTGNTDIHVNNESFEIVMAFPESSVVKAIKVVPSTTDLIVDATTGDKTNEVKFLVDNILRKRERINYVVIVESTKSLKGSHEELYFKHRIPDTDDIHDGDKQYENKKRRNYRVFECILCAMFVLFVVCEVLLYFGKYPFLNLYVSSQIPFAVVVMTLLLYKWYDMRTDKKYMKISYGL